MDVLKEPKSLVESRESVAIEAGLAEGSAVGDLTSQSTPAPVSRCASAVVAQGVSRTAVPAGAETTSHHASGAAVPTGRTASHDIASVSTPSHHANATKLRVASGMEGLSTQSPSADHSIAVQDWGLVPYEEAFKRQLDLVELVRQELARETIIFCTHPPVVTLGRGTLPGDVFGWTGETVQVNRGGRATYHGPNQIVVYPILDLNIRGRDLHRYMRYLEEAIIRTLQEFGIRASGKSSQVMEDETVEATGVWVGSRKMASIGIGVRKWVSFHGLALNVHHDPKAFQGMKPCGFTTSTMISMEEVLGAPVDVEAVKVSLMRSLVDVLK